VLEDLRGGAGLLQNFVHEEVKYLAVEFDTWLAKDQLADVFGIELESDGGTTRSAPAQQDQSKRNRKAVAAEEAKDRAGTRRARNEASPVSGNSANSKRSMLTAIERKRIAEAQRKRWQAIRERMLPQNSNGNSLSPTRVKETAKAKSAPSKSARRVRAV
jgi:hypothetical protein